MNTIIALFALFIGLAYHSAGEAKLFRNSYISFELPPNWDCQLEATEWVCRSQFNDQSREAIIILTAKEKGPSDTFPEYEKHLKEPRQVITGPGKSERSVVQHVKAVSINDQQWIDGWHLSSEIPGYYTRYLATIKKNIAILVTFTAHKKHYTKYSRDFFKAIQSMRVIATANLLTDPVTSSGMRSSGESLGASIGEAMPSDLLGAQSLPSEGSGGGSRSRKYLAILLLAAAAGAYFFLKKK